MARLFSSLNELHAAATPVIGDSHSPRLLDEHELRDSLIDDLIYTAMFAEEDELQQAATTMITSLALLCGAVPSSILPLYQAFGHGKVNGFTVPALNIRTLTYDTARMIFSLMNEMKIGPVVFEIARTEMEYTHQRPQEYATAIFAAAIKAGYRGPIFLQGDHFQVSKRRFDEQPEEEVQRLKELIDEAMQAQFYQIDIDASTLVDLTQPNLIDQQRLNSQVTSQLATYIRSRQPANVAVSIGAEIGHIGDRNSTVEDFEAFISLVAASLPPHELAKISVQTGSSHGGTLLPDGTLQQVAIDFPVLAQISSLAREKYQIGGAVQHGASTLPLSDFDQFVTHQTLEVHLATGLQNLVFENLPHDLAEEMTTWIKEHLSDERKDTQTDEQFLYTTRKKALGPFKQVLWDLSPEEKEPILSSLRTYLSTIFYKLKVVNTAPILMRFVSTK